MSPLSYRDAVAEFERAYLTTLLESTKYNVTHAARRAGVDRTTIHRMMDKHGVRRPERAFDAVRLVRSLSPARREALREALSRV